MCLGDPCEDPITVYTQLHPHLPGACSQGKVPTLFWCSHVRMVLIVPTILWKAQL